MVAYTGTHKERENVASITSRTPHGVIMERKAKKSQFRKLDHDRNHVPEQTLTHTCLDQTQLYRQLLYLF